MLRKYLFIYIFVFFSSYSKGALNSTLLEREGLGEDIVTTLNPYDKKFLDISTEITQSKASLCSCKNISRLAVAVVIATGCLGVLQFLEAQLTGVSLSWGAAAAGVVGVYGIAITVSSDFMTMPLSSAVGRLTFRVVTNHRNKIARPSNANEYLWFIINTFSLNWRETRNIMKDAVIYLQNLELSFLSNCCLPTANSEDKEQDFIDALSNIFITEFIQLFPDVCMWHDFLVAFHLRIQKVLVKSDIEPSRKLAIDLARKSLEKMLCLAKRQAPNPSVYPQENIHIICQLARCVGKASDDPILNKYSPPRI